MAERAPFAVSSGSALAKQFDGCRHEVYVFPTTLVSTDVWNPNGNAYQGQARNQTNVASFNLPNAAIIPVTGIAWFSNVQGRWALNPTTGVYTYTGNAATSGGVLHVWKKG